MGLSRGSYPDWPKEMISFAPESRSKEVLFATFGDPWDLVNFGIDVGQWIHNLLGVQKHHLNLHTYKLELPPTQDAIVTTRIIPFLGSGIPN